VSDDLLKYYNKELSYFRRAAAGFSQQHPKIASRLRLGKDTVADPHVERLIESAAFLNARVRKKLDDDFTDLSEAILGALYPHYLAPIPSMAIVQFNAQPELTAPYRIPRGAEVETEPVDGEPCRFRTSSEVTILPVAVEEADFMGGAYVAPGSSGTKGAKAVIRLVLTCQSAEVTFEQLSPGKLRFYLRGDMTDVYPLYTIIFNHLIGVSIADSANDSTAVFLDKGCIQPVGFDREEALLPYNARSMLGYQLLTEYFIFPQKFLFFDIVGLDEKLLVKRGNRLEIYLYLDKGTTDLERNISAGNFALGCAPVVNLFKQRAEPVTLTQTEHEYRVVPDARRLMAKEVYSIDNVKASSADGEALNYKPFYGFDHGEGAASPAAYWYSSREQAEQHNPSQPDYGTEVFVSLVDLRLSASVRNDWILSVDTTCMNRDLPGRLPFGGGQPKLQLGDGSAPIKNIECLTPPTPTRRPELGEGTRWRLVSHLNLNHLSLLDSNSGAEVLREMLRLYNFDDSLSSRAVIDSILGIESSQTISRVRHKGMSGVCRGLEITLVVDESRFDAQGMFLFGSVLERFFALYAPINSFTRLVLTSPNREVPLRKWPPRAGEKLLV